MHENGDSLADIVEEDQAEAQAAEGNPVLQKDFQLCTRGFPSSHLTAHDRPRATPCVVRALAFLATNSIEG